MDDAVRRAASSPLSSACPKLALEVDQFLDDFVRGGDHPRRGLVAARGQYHVGECLLHLDVNNIYVNSQKFGFDPLAFMDALPLERTCYIHVAGHYVEPDGLLIDTHGAEVIDPVWSLLETAYQHVGNIPTCLERDFNIPDLDALSAEVGVIARLQSGISPHQQKVA